MVQESNVIELAVRYLNRLSDYFLYSRCSAITKRAFQRFSGNRERRLRRTFRPFRRALTLSGTGADAVPAVGTCEYRNGQYLPHHRAGPDGTLPETYELRIARPADFCSRLVSTYGFTKPAWSGTSRWFRVLMTLFWPCASKGLRPAGYPSGSAQHLRAQESTSQGLTGTSPFTPRTSVRCLSPPGRAWPLSCPWSEPECANLRSFTERGPWRDCTIESYSKAAPGRSCPA